MAAKIRIKVHEPPKAATLSAEHFDLYLLDVWLPDLDGFELCRRMRHLQPHTPILFFSGAGYETDKQRAIEAGANTYVIKPDLSGLIENVTHFIPQAQSAVA